MTTSSPAFSTPQWVHDAIFYQIFPDRFAASTRLIKPNNLEAWDTPPTQLGYKGGDLLGVAERLDYLQDLGINAIYFTPVFQSASNHHYHTHDYFKIDPLLGGQPAFDTLLKEAHRRGMRVVLDGVFNHASRGFFQFNDILENEAASPYLDWFNVKGFPLNAYWGKPNYEAWADLAALPEFNHANPQVRRFIFDAARYWIDQGIDGWRLDVPFCIDDDSFWQEFRQVVKNANPQAYITGEIPGDATRWLRGDQFDGVMNYLLAYACWGFFGGGQLDRGLIGHWQRDDHGGLWIKPGAEAFAASITNLLERYPRPAVQAQLNLLDSHDTARVLSIFRGDRAAFKLAETFLFTYPGAPCIYYGNEIGLEGGQDPDCRRSFPWDEKRWDRELRAYLQKLAVLRQSHPALRDGDFKVLKASGDLMVYLRSLSAEREIIAINRAPESAAISIDLSHELEDSCHLRELLGGAETRLQNGRLEATLPPKSAAVWENVLAGL